MTLPRRVVFALLAAAFQKMLLLPPHQAALWTVSFAIRRAHCRLVYSPLSRRFCPLNLVRIWSKRVPLNLQAEDFSATVVSSKDENLLLLRDSCLKFELELESDNDNKQ